MKLRTFQKLLWIPFLTSALLIAWQGIAYITDNIPDHILPFVKILSGTEQAVPVAYSWTGRLGVASAAVFLISLFLLVVSHFARPKSKGSDNGKG